MARVRDGEEYGAPDPEDSHFDLRKAVLDGEPIPRLATVEQLRKVLRIVEETLRIAVENEEYRLGDCMKTEERIDELRKELE